MNMENINVDRCLQNFGSQIGLSLTFDESQRCTILIDSKYEICFEKDNSNLIIQAVIMPIVNFTIEHYREFLKASYLGVQTKKYAFSIDPQDEMLFMWQYIENIREDLDLTSYVHDIIGQIAYWKQELNQDKSHTDSERKIYASLLNDSA